MTEITTFKLNLKLVKILMCSRRENEDKFAFHPYNPHWSHACQTKPVFKAIWLQQ